MKIAFGILLLLIMIISVFNSSHLGCGLVACACIWALTMLIMSK